LIISQLIYVVVGSVINKNHLGNFRLDLIGGIGLSTYSTLSTALTARLTLLQDAIVDKIFFKEVSWLT